MVSISSARLGSAQVLVLALLQAPSDSTIEATACYELENQRPSFGYTKFVQNAMSTNNFATCLMS
jgi:hypothetical protein